MFVYNRCTGCLPPFAPANRDIMSKSLINLVVFLSGLAVAGWIGAGYAGANPLALAVTLLICACYLTGALELLRYQQATAALKQAADGLSEAPVSLSAWLGQLPPGLRHPVRLRIEGERAGLPGPTLAPYLAGLLVLLGMLGTFLGMVATLRGTGTALESATDLAAIRASLAAPVKGLGFAFGTSIAGVATSAMLGLLAALCRRDRIQAAQWLDTQAAATLRRYTQSHQREERFKLLQRQAEIMPALVDRLDTMMRRLEQQSLALNERQLASQEAFQSKAEAAYTRLAAAMEQSMRESVTVSARSAGAALQLAIEATLAGLSRETASLHDSVTRALQQQLDGMSVGLQAATADVAGIWNQALASQQRASETLAQDLRASLEGFAQSFEQRSTTLLDGVSARLQASSNRLSEAWTLALSRQERANEKLSGDNRQALTTAAAVFEQHSAALLQTLGQAQAGLQAELAAQDQQRLAVWTGKLDAMADALRQEWQQADARGASQQQEICATLAHTAQAIATQTEARTSSTIAEIRHLLQAASQAPRAAAEVIGELRQKLSDSLAHDNAMLAERNRLLDTLATLLDAVNHTSSEQRAAVDALVSSSSDLLNRVGAQFTDKVETETGRLSEVAAQVTSSAVEVASLGDAFGTAARLFGESNDKLVAHLQRIEAALDKSIARGDEQLAYYVAQAREVIDLSTLSQQQIIENLRQLANQRDADAGARAA